MSSLPAKTIALLDRAEGGDAEAAFEFCEIYKPEGIDDLISFICGDSPCPTRLFDALADAFDAYHSVEAA